MFKCAVVQSNPSIYHFLLDIHVYTCHKHRSMPFSEYNSIVLCTETSSHLIRESVTELHGAYRDVPASSADCFIIFPNCKNARILVFVSADTDAKRQGLLQSVTVRWPYQIHIWHSHWRLSVEDSEFWWKSENSYMENGFPVRQSCRSIAVLLWTTMSTISYLKTESERDLA